MTSTAALAFAPLLPLPLLAALVLLSLAVWALAVARRARGAWWRLVAPLVLLAALAGPRLVVENRQPLPDVAVVVVDHSRSQAVGDRRDRTDAAAAELHRRLAALPGLEVREERVGDAPDDGGTRLFAALDRALADLPRDRLAGVVMLTDGLVHDVPADPDRLGAPVHVLLTGRPGERDRRLVMHDTPGFALVGHTALVRFSVEDTGAAGEVPVEVRVDGEPYASLAAPPGRQVEIEVPIRHAGQNVVELATPAVPDELTAANNRVAAGITGVRDRLRVLLISGEPHVGERAWRNLLKSDPAVDLVHFTILRPPDKDDGTPLREMSLIAFPVRELFGEKLHDFDLVVFDRYRRRNVLSAETWQALADYVRGGGALLVAAGPEFAGPGGVFDTPLGAVLPAGPTGAVVEHPFRPVPTEAGQRHPVTAGLAGPPSHWGRWLRRIDARPLRGTVLLDDGAGHPLLLVDRVGEGRVADILSDSLWLWARGWEGGGPHDEMLRRLAHWLMREPDLEEESLAAEIQGDRLEITRRSSQRDVAPVKVTRPDGSIADVPLAAQPDGRATAAVPVDQAGLWRVEDGHHVAIAASGQPFPRELADLAATSARLAPVAAATGGSVHWLAEGIPELRRVSAGAVKSGRTWIGLATRGGTVVRGVREIPLLPGIVLALLALAGLLLAWLGEGR